MNLSVTLAKHLNGVFFGGNWTSSNLKDQLSNVTLKEASFKVEKCNTILALTYHISYYIAGVLEVFKNKPLIIKDKYSYDHPKLKSEDEWQNMLNEIWSNTESLIKHIEQLTNEELWQDFTDAKYGSYYSNITGIIEHTHYHLGQIVLLKKLIKNPS